MSGDFDPTSADGETARDAPVSGHVMDPVVNIPLWKALVIPGWQSKVSGG